MSNGSSWDLETAGQDRMGDLSSVRKHLQYLHQPHQEWQYKVRHSNCLAT
jgi:hypothetical protein